MDSHAPLPWGLLTLGGAKVSLHMLRWSLWVNRKGSLLRSETSLAKDGSPGGLSLRLCTWPSMGCYRGRTLPFTSSELHH